MSAPVDDVLRGAGEGTVGAPELFEALAGASLFLAIASNDESSAQPWILRHEDVDHAVVCTGQAHAELVPDVPAWAELAGRDLGAGWPAGLRAVINPGTDFALILDADAMRSLAGADARVPAGTAYAVGAPAEAPEPALVAAVHDAVQATAGAQAGYLFQFAPEGSTPRLVCGVVLDDGADPNVVIPPLADAVVRDHPTARTLDFTPLDGTLREQVVELVPPL